MQMRHIFLVLFPFIFAVATASPLILLTTSKDSRLLFKLVVSSLFLFTSGFVAEVAVPGLNKVIIGDFYNDIGVIGFSERIFLSLVIYACIIMALSKSIRFKSTNSMIIFIVSSSAIFGIFFELFVKYF